MGRFNEHCTSCLMAAFAVSFALFFPLNASTVVIQKNGTVWQLLKDGQPYYVKGAGGGASPEKLVAAGGNSIRTWSPDKAVLDKAQTLGLTVCLGISGNNYTQALQSVQTYKNHSALLMWGLGNEMESGVADQVALWKLVDSIARAIKQLDGQHPCITVVADIGGNKLQNIALYAPNLDAVGINTYGGLASLKSRVTQTGWTKPYFVTEFGPIGWWECAKTSWGVPIEQTSTEKENTYVTNYQNNIQGNAQCLGGYVFLWGNKQEKTHTWFGMFLADGSPVGTVDGMQFLWTGAYPANQCPRIKAGKIRVGRTDAFNNGSDRSFRPGRQLLCIVDTDDPDGDQVTITWDLRVDVSDNGATGGGYEPPSVPIAGAVLAASRDTAVIQLPADTNKYRIFCYVKDPEGSAATVNCPILVNNNAPEPVIHIVNTKSSGSAPLLVASGGRGKAAVIQVHLDRETFITLGIYSVRGELLAEIDRGVRTAGPHSYTWRPRSVGAGTYYIKLFRQGMVATRKMVVLQ
jgi:hypothetical protein